MPPPRIYFIRHGETDWNAAGRLQGQHDIALNERGRQQAAQAAQQLRDAVADPGALPWIVSPLERTRDTAEIARTALGLRREDYSLEPIIVELSFGRWEGLTWREVGRLDPLAAREREMNKWAMVPPGGDSYALLAERIRPWLESLTQDIVAVSHAGVARVLLHLHAGLAVQKAPKEDIWQGRVLVIEQGRSYWS